MRGGESMLALVPLLLLLGCGTTAGFGTPKLPGEQTEHPGRNIYCKFTGVKIIIWPITEAPEACSEMGGVIKSDVR